MLLTTTWTQITSIAGLGASVQKSSIDKVLVKYSPIQPVDVSNSFVVRDYVKNEFYNGEAGEYLWARAADSAVEVAYEQLDLSTGGGGGGGGGSMTNLEVKVAYESNANTNAFTDADELKLDGIEAGATGDQTSAEIKTLYESESNTNAFTDVEKSKLANIEANATADQTDAEIKAAYEANSDTNAFTDALSTKLDGIESGATGDQSGAEIKVAYESQGDTNAFTDAEKIKLGGVESNATADQTGAEIKALYEGELDTNAFTDSEKTKLGTVESNATADQTDLEIKTAYENNANTNAFTDAQVSKLTGIESNATGDQTGAEIKIAYEGNADTNAFTDSEKTKLADIESNATGDQTDVEIKTAYENNSDTNAFTDAEKAKLSGLSDPLFLGVFTSISLLDAAHPTPAIGSHAHIDTGAGSDSQLAIWDNDDSKFVLSSGGGTETSASIKTKYEANADTNAYTDVEKSKLGGIELNATADQTGAEIKLAYEAEANTNAFTDAEKLKLQNTEANATADQTGAEIKAAYEAEADTNAYTDAEKTKLGTIETNADQTDTTNVTAAGALMDSELTNITAVKGLNQALTTGSDVTFRSVDIDVAGNSIGLANGSAGDFTDWASGIHLDLRSESSAHNALSLGATQTGNGQSCGSVLFYNDDNADSTFGSVQSKNVAAMSSWTVSADSNTGDDSGGELAFYTKPEGGVLKEVARLDDSGNLGLGTGNPAYNLHVSDAGLAHVGIESAGSGSSDFAQITLDTNSASLGALWKNPSSQFGYGGAGSLNIGTLGAENLALVTDGTPRIIVESGGTTKILGDIETTGRLLGGFGAKSTAGVLDWDDVTNSRAGSGEVLLTNTAANKPPADNFFHPFNFEYSSKDGTGNLTQFAFPYGQPESIDAGIYMRGRFSGTWNNWCKLLTENTSGNIGIGTLTPNYGNFSKTMTLESTVVGAYELASSRPDDDSAQIGALSFSYQTNSSGHNLIGQIDCETDGTTPNQRGGALRLFTKPDGSATPIQRMTVKESGIVNIANAPTYPDDASAGAGGLVVGDIYKTASGNLKIKL